MRIPRDWVAPYYMKVGDGPREPYSGICHACKAKFYGEYARAIHMRSPKHQAMVRKWHHACQVAGVDSPAVINIQV